MSGSDELTHDDIARILRIVDEAGDIEVVVETASMKLRFHKGTTGAVRNGMLQIAAPAAGDVAPRPATSAGIAVPDRASSEPQAVLVPAPSAEPGPGGAETPAAEVVLSAAREPDGAQFPDGAELVRAPMVGRFFRASSPAEAPFVEVGSKTGPDDTVCLIEVMKLFTTVSAGVSGTITQILVDNEDLVEEGQPLFVVQPD